MKIHALLYCALLPASTFLATEASAQLAGTLFTEPEEREYLDYLRAEFLRNNKEAGFDIEEVIPVVPDDQAAVETGPQEFTFGGLMTRRDGERSVWLNGRLLAESKLPSGIRLMDADPSTSLRIAQDGRIFVLRPGQTVTLATGVIVENYQRIAVAEPPPAEVEAVLSAESGNAQVAEDAAISAATDESEMSAALEDAPSEQTDLVTTLTEALRVLTPDEKRDLVDALTRATESAAGNAEEADENLDDE
ncbi:MAG: hypothetical protein RLZZ227_1590 [Pseudomonadota bacterium]|jgi:hypothetical protein